MKKLVLLILIVASATGVTAQNKGSEVKPDEAKKTPQKAVTATPSAERSKPKPKSGEPSTAIDFLLRGNIKQEADDMEGALEDYNTSISIDDKFPRGYLSRGAVKFILQDFEAAIVDFNTAIELAEKEIEACNKRGNVKTILEDHKGATKEFNKAEAMRPILAESLFNRGNVKYFLDDKTGCCEDLQTSGNLGFLKSYNYIRKYCQ